MDALKIISEGSIKAEKPQFNVGDTVRVDVRIKEGERERIQAFEGTVIAKKHGASQRPLPFAAFPTASASSVSSPSTAPSSRRSLLSVRARSAAQSCSTCVVVPARLPRSRAIFDDSPFQSGRKGDNSFVPFFLLYGAFGAETEKIKRAEARIKRCIGYGTVTACCPWAGLAGMVRSAYFGGAGAGAGVFLFLPYHSGGRRVDGA